MSFKTTIKKPLFISTVLLAIATVALGIVLAIVATRPMHKYDIEITNLDYNITNFKLTNPQDIDNELENANYTFNLSVFGHIQDFNYKNTEYNFLSVNITVGLSVTDGYINDNLLGTILVPKINPSLDWSISGDLRMSSSNFSLTPNTQDIFRNVRILSIFTTRNNSYYA